MCLFLLNIFFFLFPECNEKLLSIRLILLLLFPNDDDDDDNDDDADNGDERR